MNHMNRKEFIKNTGLAAASLTAFSSMQSLARTGGEKVKARAWMEERRQAPMVF